MSPKMFLTTFLIIFTACTSSNEFIKQGVELKKYKRIAILPLTDYYSAPGSGNQIADVVSMKLLASPIQIIDRTQTQKLLEEQSIGLTGNLDPNTVSEVGKLLGVQAFLTGSINQWSSSKVNIQVVQGAAPAWMDIAKAGITLKLIDTNSGEIVWAGSAEGSTTGPNQEYKAASKATGDLIKKFLSHF